MTRQSITLYNAQQGYAAMAELWRCCKASLIAGHRLVVEARFETRSDAQNRRMWAILTDVSKQVLWYGKRLTPEDWKHVFTASVRKLEVVPNIEGTGFVALGLSTSQMTKAEHSALTDLAMAFGDERGVNWSPTSLGREWAGVMEEVA